MMQSPLDMPDYKMYMKSLPRGFVFYSVEFGSEKKIRRRDEMRKVKKRILATILAVALGVSSAPFNVGATESTTENVVKPVSANEDDKTGPTVDVSNISVDKSEVEIGGRVTFSVGVTVDTDSYDKNGIQYVTLTYSNVDNGYSIDGEYNEKTGKYDFTTPPLQFYGKNEIDSIRVADLYGNVTIYQDKNITYFRGAWDNAIDVDMSSGDFTVTGGTGDDTTAPNIMLDTISIDNKEIELNGYVTLSVKIEDDSPIAYAELLYYNAASGCSSVAEYNESKGTYDFIMTSSVYGENEIAMIRAKDAYGNEKKYIDKSCAYWENALTDGDEADLSAGNFNVVGGNNNDNEGPSINIASIKIDKNTASLNERIKLYLEVTDDSGIQDVELVYENADNGYQTQGEYNSETGLYEFIMFSPVYGKNEVSSIRATDRYGNTTIYQDKNITYYRGAWDGATDVDLSAGDFYVGIQDENTGIFVSNSSLDDTSRLYVDVKDKKGNEYEKLLEKGYKGENFYEIHMSGKYDFSKEDARVFFKAPDGTKNGDRVRIRHLLSDGTIQTEDRYVEDGKIWIDVRQFSPFLLEVVDNSGNTPTTTEAKKEADEPIADTVKDITVSYKTHIQSKGWETSWLTNGAISGTVGNAKRLEAIDIKVSGNSNLGIQYTTHCQSYGWLPWSSNGEMSGTEGEAKRLEAIKIQLTGADKDNYDVYYRVHAQSYGWFNWAKNGEPAGTAGYAKRLEAIQIVVVKKGESIDVNMGGVASKQASAYISNSGASSEVSGSDTTNVAYRTHVQSYGWQGWKYNGKMSGTSGEAKRLEGIKIQLTNKQYSGGIKYRTHVQTYGWEKEWRSDGAMSGTSGEAKRLEAIQIELTGEMAEHYDVYYRVHAQSYGWLGWAKNGESAGTAGYAKRLEGIQIVLVPKGESAPAASYGGVTSKLTTAYISK